MQLNKHPQNITDPESWFAARPPKKGKFQWVDGRSAKELAKYMTHHLPSVPAQIEAVLKALVPVNTSFDWDAEYVTALPGFGEGRNHDAIMYHPDVLVAIEAKADEVFGKLIAEEIQHASVNKLHRISTMLGCLFSGGFKNYGDLRYQLLIASVGTMLEAKKRGIDTAVFLVLVFKTNGNVADDKQAANHQDIENFLKAVHAFDEHGLMCLPNNTGVTLYFKEIVI